VDGSFFPRLKPGVTEPNFLMVSDPFVLIRIIRVIRGLFFLRGEKVFTACKEGGGGKKYFTISKYILQECSESVVEKGVQI
jgi:hypothetical protein